MEDVKQTFYRSAKEYLQEIGRLDTGAKQIAECFRPEDLVRITAEEHIRAYEIPEEAACIRQFRSACKKLNLPGCLEESFGGSDNNRLAEHGIFGRVLSCGMYNIHTVNECAKIHDMEKAAGLAAELITG